MLPVKPSSNPVMKFLSPGFLLLWSCFAAAAAAVNIASDADTTIFIGTISPGSSDGPEFVSGSTPAGGIGRALLHFDVSSIPTNALIDSASVTVSVTKKSSQAPGANSYDLCLVTRDWSESAASWGAATATTSWTSTGGDYEEASASVNIDTGTGTFSSSGLMADVQAWVHGGVSNAGWLMRASSEVEGASGRRFASHEYPTPGSRPTLTVTYHLPAPPPPQPMIVTTRREGGDIKFAFVAQPGLSYTVEYLNFIGDTWHDLTNINVTALTNAAVVNGIGSGERIYRVRVAVP